MNPMHTCDEIQLLASEVALGIASGDERAFVLAHAKSCEDCRRVMEELSATSDALLLLGPHHEPSSGFESMVLSKMHSTQRSPTRLPKLIAAALASVLVTGAAAFWITSDDREVATHYRDALAVADGKYFGVVPLRTTNGDRSGHVFAYEGDPSWVFLIFAEPLEPGRYEVELETTAGRIEVLGTFTPATGDVTWGTDLPVGLREVRTVRMLDDNGVVALQAIFPSE